MTEYIEKETLDSELYNRFHDEDESSNITDVRLGSVRNFVRDFPTADVIEREKIDKAIKEMKALVDPQNTILGFDEKMGVKVAMNILVRNIGE